MHRGFACLHTLARGLLEAAAIIGHVFGFCNKVCKPLKLVCWDGSGLWVCAQRLDERRFAWSSQARDADPCADAHAPAIALQRMIIVQTEQAILFSMA
jgi:transposase